MRILTLLLSVFLSTPCLANMGSGVHEGTLTASPFISKYVDIVGEKILIVPDKNFKTAFFRIEYQIRSSRDGLRIPLLFYASEYRESFRVWIDGRAVTIKQVPDAYKKLEGTPFSDFNHLFTIENRDESQQVLIEDHATGGFYVSVNDLKYFETDILQGIHNIRVEYVANQWMDREHWIREYTFRYVLSPAKTWRSFSNLEIKLDASRFNGNLTTNLGEPDNVTGAISTWKFSRLPGEILKIQFTPEVSALAKVLLWLKPEGMALIFAIIFIVLHFVWMKRFRSRNHTSRFSKAVILGSILTPLLVLVFLIFCFDIIDIAIGPEAGKFHGYVFLVIVLYPVVVPIYLIIMGAVDRILKKRFSRRAALYNQTKASTGV
jgi:hypothetical protein